MNLTILTTTLSIVLNIIQAITKCVVGTLSHSNAMFMDGLHGIADILTNAIVLLAAMYAAKPADNKYPYGRGRYESLAMLMISLVLISVSFKLLANTITNKEVVQTHMYSWIFGVSLFSASSSLIAYIWMYRQAAEHSNDLIYGNAIHQLSDALSSVIVLFSCITEYFGYVGSDTFATILVVFLIVYGTIPVLKNALRELTDHSTGSAYLDQLRKKILKTPGIDEIHHLRTRRSASRIILDLHITLCHHLTFTESHWVAELLTDQLKKDDPEIADVLIHVDPDVDILDTLHARETYLKMWANLGIPNHLLSPDLFLMNYLGHGIVVDWKIISGSEYGTYKKWAHAIRELTPEILQINLLSTNEAV